MALLSDLVQIHDALLRIQSGQLSAPHAGICFNLDIQTDGLGAAYHFIDRAMQEIFGFSADFIDPYPIEGNNWDYMENRDKWNPETVHGAKRLYTLQKVIDICKREMKECVDV